MEIVAMSPNCLGTAHVVSPNNNLRRGGRAQHKFQICLFRINVLIYWRLQEYTEFCYTTRFCYL